jgi:hypothetical protein
VAVRVTAGGGHVAGATTWTERENYLDYLGWRTESGYTDTFEAMLTQPPAAP